MPNVPITSKMSVRVLVIDLENGEKEYLMTTLMDSGKFHHAIFGEIYNMRWGTEEGYKFIKIDAEIENFSTKTILGIEQEFYGTIVMSNVRALLANEAQEEFELEKIKPCKYEHKINRNISLGILKNGFVKVLFNDNESIDDFCERAKCLMKKNTIPIRKGRKFPRKRKAVRRHHITIRRNL